MAFVPNYKYDIFVSYAHVDNKPLPGAEVGWVTTLIEALETRLSQRLGRSEFYKLWIDDELSPHNSITPQILNTLKGSAVIIIIMSPGYLASDWCRREKDTFCSLINKRISSGSRIFIVERDIVGHKNRPDEFKELIGVRFWVRDQRGKAPKILGLPKPDPSDHRYYDLINDLSLDIAKELERLQELEKGISKAEQVSELSPAIFLAEVTDDLEPQRDDVKRYLDQHNLRVLPEGLYPREPSQFKEAVKLDLSKSILFVQLLSNIRGKMLPGLSTTYTCLQYKSASQSGKSILQWRNRDLDISAISDTDHKTLLEKETVMAVGFEEFKRTIVERAQYKPPASQIKSLNAFVFVNRVTNDIAIAENVIKHLDQYNAAYALPLQEGKPADMREDLERNLLECDGVIIVYGTITASWVREQLRQCRKILAKRDRPLRALAVYEGPPESKVPLDLKLPHMHIINCRKGHKEIELKSFFESLKVE